MATSSRPISCSRTMAAAAAEASPHLTARSRWPSVSSKAMVVAVVVASARRTLCSHSSEDALAAEKAPA